METVRKKKQQAEWLQHVTLTHDEFKKLIEQKLERNKQLQCKKKSQESNNFAL